MNVLLIKLINQWKKIIHGLEESGFPYGYLFSFLPKHQKSTTHKCE
jgi:hypothetical protein